MSPFQLLSLCLLFWTAFAFRLPGANPYLLRCKPSLKFAVSQTWMQTRVHKSTRLRAIEDFETYLNEDDDDDEDENSEDDDDEDGGIYDSRSLKKEEDFPSTMYEVTRKYRLLYRDLLRFQSPMSEGYAGVVISLDTVLTDLTDVFTYAFALLAEKLGMEEPDATTIRDSVGSTFRDFTIALGWDIPSEDMRDLEEQFFLYVQVGLSKVSVQPQDGATELVHSLLEQGNDIAVVSSLPRHLALKVLGKSRVSTVFEHHGINPNRLVSYDLEPAPRSPNEDVLGYGQYESFSDGENKDEDGTDEWRNSEDYDEDYGDRFMDKRFLRIFGLFKKAPALIALIDGNRKHLLSARRHGMSSIAVAGKSMCPAACVFIEVKYLSTPFFFALALV